MRLLRGGRGSLRAELAQAFYENHRHAGVAVGAGRRMRSEKVPYRRHAINWSSASRSLTLVGQRGVP